LKKVWADRPTAVRFRVKRPDLEYKLPRKLNLVGRDAGEPFTKCVKMEGTQNIE
jgi:hypothetical protein